jgi:site-specific DNA recombinase
MPLYTFLMKRAPKTALIYTRLSRDAVGTGAGVARQEEECRDYCARLGWEVVEVYTDNDISATSGVRRPGFEQLLKDMAGGVADVIVVWHQDRLLRLSKDLETVITLDVPIHTVAGGSFDLTNPAGRAVAKTVAAWSQYETEQKALRQRSANRQRALSGIRFKAGTRFFGWEEDRVTLNAKEAEAIREATRSIIDGGSVNAIAVAWEANPELNPTRGGKKWTAASVRSILLRESNAGIVVSNGERVPDVQGQWESIVSVEEFEACAAVLSNPNRRKSKSTSLKYFISGMVKCGVCGSEMRVATASVKRRGKVEKHKIFRCTSKESHGSRAVAPVIDAVEESIIDRLSAEDAAELFAPVPTSANQKKALAEIDRIRARLRDSEQDYANSDMSGPEFRSIQALLNQQLKSAQIAASDQTLTRVPERIRKAKPSQVRAVWESLTPADQRRVADVLLSVTVYPTSDLKYGDWPYGAVIDWK